METLLVRLSPWAKARILRDYGKPGREKVHKQMLRRSLDEVPMTEFTTIATPIMRGGMTTTYREAYEMGYDTLEVRLNGDRDTAVVVVNHDGRVVVR